MMQFRTIDRASVNEALQPFAQIAAGEEDLRRRGIDLSHAEWADGLGPYHGAYVEFPGGAQILIRSFDDANEDTPFDVLGSLTHSAEDLLAALEGVLDADRELITWRVPSDDWRSVQEMYNRRPMS